MQQILSLLCFSCIKFHETLICTVLTVIPYLFFTMTLLVTPAVPLMKSNICFARESPTMINSGDPHSGPWICNNHFPWVKFVFQNSALFFKPSHAVKIPICFTETAFSSLSCFFPPEHTLVKPYKGIGVVFHGLVTFSLVQFWMFLQFFGCHMFSV